MRKTKVYLGGAMSNITPEEASKWRKKAKHLLDVLEIKSIDPTYYYNFNLDPSTYTEREVMEFDLAATVASDIVLVNLDFPDSVGTSIEAFYAYRILRKPVIGFGTNSNVHPWLQECLSKRCNTLEDAVEYIASYYGQILG
jgi:nucleoside 2-deoxyribosyltransferase